MIHNGGVQVATRHYSKRLLCYTPIPGTWGGGRAGTLELNNNFYIVDQTLSNCRRPIHNRDLCRSLRGRPALCPRNAKNRGRDRPRPIYFRPAMSLMAVYNATGGNPGDPESESGHRAADQRSAHPEMESPHCSEESRDRAACRRTIHM